MREVSYFLAVTCGAVFAWRLLHALRAPRSPDPWTSVLFSAGLGVMVLLNRPDFSRWVDEVLGSHTAGIVRNLMIVGAFASMQLFYLRNIAEYRPRQRRYVEIAALIATVLVILIVPLFVMAPFELSFTSHDIQDPAVLVFFVSVSAYLVYACITQVYWTTRDSITIYKKRAWDFLVVAVSLAVGCGVYLILLGSRASYYAQVLFGSGSASINMWSGGLVAIRVSVLAMLLAVFYPGAADDFRLLLHRGAQMYSYARLAPLDRVVRSLYPELVRPDVPLGGGESSEVIRRVWSLPSRLSCELRGQRCSDGYARIYNVFAGFTTNDRSDVSVVVDQLRNMPSDLPERARKGETGPLVEVSEWLRQYQVPQILSTQAVKSEAK
ncbi:hypothetical protein FVA95_27825 [Pseudonocardia sp. EV170527-09]|uniref:hypothetical protein n=1 Tax=Pseudonocardia sp. EV170527-09 TaxID=2603411 RepID=UPI0011F259F8|nr:hypothetical protein [Pseudonocardia sp. EV170527-09]KAA1011545.1 hypothetical protein FVA95_27825 [Pseudonocardia sp. EV170527-09]